MYLYTCCNSPVKVQNICETTNFFMNYFLSRTGVLLLLFFMILPTFSISCFIVPTNLIKTILILLNVLYLKNLYKALFSSCSFTITIQDEHLRFVLALAVNM